MALVELPEGIDATKEAAEAVQARLYERSRIEVPFVPWNGRVYVRLSAQVYNRPSDYEHLADALPDVLRR
jgi:isopenicillin-N epimerase